MTRTILAAAIAIGAAAPWARAAPPPPGPAPPGRGGRGAAAGDELPDRRLDAAKALASKGPDIVPTLIQALGHEDWKVRRSATDALAELKADAKPAVAALITALKDKDAWVRDGAAKALGRIGPDAAPAARPLVELLKDKDDWIRESAMVALPAVTKDEALLVQGAINAVMVPDTGWSVRRHAMGILRRHAKGHKQAIPALVYMLEHPGEGMWLSLTGVAQTLAAAGAGDKATPILARLLQSDHKGMRRRAAEALGTLGQDAAPALPALRKVAGKDKDERTRAAAKKALEQIAAKKPKK